MLHHFFQERGFFLLLLHLDQDLAEKTREGNCLFCDAPLHRANYTRKPRGGPDDADLNCRFSFCCYQCRKRCTPPSFRFMGRRVYFGAIFLLVSTLLSGATPRRRQRLRDLCGADLRTLERWRRWWAETFSQGLFWQNLRARLAFPGQPHEQPPRLLFRREIHMPLAELMVEALRFLLPLFSGEGG